MISKARCIRSALAIVVLALLVVGLLQCWPQVPVGIGLTTPLIVPRVEEWVATHDETIPNSTLAIRADQVNLDNSIAHLTTPAADGSYTYDQAVEVGNWFVCLSNGNGGSNRATWMQQTPYTSVNQLAQYGWVAEDERLDDEVDPMEDPGLWKAINKFGIDENDGSMRIIQWWHSKASQPIPGGPQYHPTGAFYTNTYNVVAGVIFANDIYGPRSQGPLQEPPVTGSPSAYIPLSQWSDVTFLAWWDVCGHGQRTARKLQAVVHSHITNKNTNGSMKSAVSKANSQLTEFPGHTFSLDNANEKNSFAALLATPTGSGTAWFLLQHRARMGWKEVFEIQVYCEDCGTNTEQTFMIMGIRDHVPL